MTKLKNIISGLALAVGLTLPAQGPGEPLSVLRQAHGIQRVDGVLWGIAADYRASFTGGGMEFTPALGAAAPANQPLRITLETITRDGLLLYDAGTQPVPIASQKGDAVVYARSPGLLESFAVRADGVELSYTFTDPLPGTGDLVVRARIDTDLPFQTDATGDVRFVLDEVGGVRIGEVTGLDARGTEVAGNRRWDGTCLEMRLPAAFVDNAVYPLVLDPLIGTQFGITPSPNCVEPAVAYDTTNDVYLVVMRQNVSAGDAEIVAQRISGSGALVGSLIAVSGGRGVAIKPTVANVNIRDRFLVAWQQAPTMFGPWDIDCRSVLAGNGVLSAIVPVTNGGVDDTDPDAASDASNNDDALLVWREQAGGIRGTTVSLPFLGDPTVGAATTITSTGSAVQPAISTSHPSQTRFVVVWRESAAGNAHIKARAVSRTMALLGTELTVVSGGSRNPQLNRPDVDGNGVDFMVVYDRPEAAGNPKNNVFCRMLFWTGADLTGVGLPTAVANDLSDDEFDPAVGWLHGKYVVLWADESTGSLNYNIEGIELDDSCQPCGNRFVLTGPPRSPVSRPMELEPAIGTQRSGGRPSDEALIVFTDANVTAPFSSDIVAQRIEAFGGGPITDLGGGCGNGGTAGTNGPPALGNTDFQLTLTGAPPSAPFVFSGIGFTPAANPCGACSVMTAGNWFFVLPVPVTGNARYPLAVPCDPAFQGLPVYSQWAVFLSGANPCPLVPAGAQVSFSNRIFMTVEY